VDASELVETLQHLDADQLRTLATALRQELDTVDGELSWWRATMTIGASLRRQHRSREAGLAAHRASAAVLSAAERANGLEDARDDVTIVARAASEVARALVARSDPALPAAATASLLAPWYPFVPVAA
jgi:hypothetical protein